MKEAGAFWGRSGRRGLRIDGNQEAAAPVGARELIEKRKGVPVGIDAPIGAAGWKKAARNHRALQIKNSVDQPEVGLGTAGSGGEL